MDEILQIYWLRTLLYTVYTFFDISKTQSKIWHYVYIFNHLCRSTVQYSICPLLLLIFHSGVYKTNCFFFVKCFGRLPSHYITEVILLLFLESFCNCTYIYHIKFYVLQRAAVFPRVSTPSNKLSFLHWNTVADFDILSWV